MLTLFEPRSGEVRIQGVTSATNAVVHPWLKAQCTAILSTLPTPAACDAMTQTTLWQVWQQGLSQPITLPKMLPPLRMLLVWDNLAGHYTLDMVLWLIEHGIMPLYTPLGGSWLNMAESVQRIIVRRALDGQSPETPQQIIDALDPGGHGQKLEPRTDTFCLGRQTRRSAAAQPQTSSCARRLGCLLLPACATAHRLTQEMAEVMPNDPLVHESMRDAELHPSEDVCALSATSAIARPGPRKP